MLLAGRWQKMMFELENVSKVFKVGTFGGKELIAVDKVNFSIAEGEIIVLIGESGSGKTTIGKMILRLLDISSGKINFRGKDISGYKNEKLKEYYRNVQGVFQDPFSSINPIFKADRIFETVHEEFFSDISKAEWKDKVETTLLRVGLNPEHILNKYPHQLSGGQLQRFLIARALLLDIDFLVADEVISMLDASTRIDVLNLLGELRESGLSILFITHDLSLGYYISDRSVILYKGRIAEMGDTQKIFNNPLHPYTKMLLASVPQIDKEWDRDVMLIEDGAQEMGTGCVYYDRCLNPGKDQKCLHQAPELIEVEPGHFVSCWHI
jgi:peptide/nickel transport system ATP-binding protein